MRLDDDLKYFEESEFKDVLAKYETAREAGLPVYMDADDLTDIAEYYSFVCHDDEKANEAISFALQLHPEAVDPQIFKARQYMTKGDWEQAQYCCDAIEDQQNREVLFLQAELMIHAEHSDQAMNLLFNAAQEIEEDRDFFLYDSAYIFIDYRLFDWALIFANALEEMAADWYKTWQVQADVQLGLEHYRLALKYLDRMLDVDPFHLEAWNWSAEAYCGIADYEKAANSLEYALAIDPDNERALQLKAWLFLQQGNFSEAHKLYQKEIEKAPDNEQNWLYDSYCLLDEDRVDEALAAIEKAEELAEGLSPEQTTIYEQHAQVLSRKGRVEEAIRYLDKAEWESGSDVDPADFDLFRARICAENHRLDDTLSYIRKACEKADEEQQSDIKYRAGQLFFEVDEFEMAKDIFEGLLADTGDVLDQAEYHAYLAYCAMALEDDQAALKHLQAAQGNAQERLKELFEEVFPNVQPTDYYHYYYYRVYGRWP